MSDYNTTDKVRHRENLIGQKFGMLIVLEQIEDYVRPNGQMIKILNNKRRVYYGKKIRKS